MVFLDVTGPQVCSAFCLMLQDTLGERTANGVLLVAGLALGWWRTRKAITTAKAATETATKAKQRATVAEKEATVARSALETLQLSLRPSEASATVVAEVDGAPPQASETTSPKASDGDPPVR